MTISLRERGIQAILLDIEGTTTPIAFVQEVLFPFAAANLERFVSDPRHTGIVADVIARLAREYADDLANGAAVPAWDVTSDVSAGASLVAYARWLMASDRKSPGLKELQGHIWEEGYQAGQLQGQVFADVPRSIARWHAAGMTIAIYSSGSELAQRRLFESTPAGDLTRAISGFFDTRVGAKVEAGSYVRIAEAIGRRPRETLFVSDVTRELNAARDAGLPVALSVRPGNPTEPDADDFESVTSLDEIEI